MHSGAKSNSNEKGQIFEIIKDIDKHIISLPLLGWDTNRAIKELLLAHAERSILHLVNLDRQLRGGPTKTDHRLEERIIQESLKWGLRWIFSKSSASGTKNPDRTIKILAHQVLQIGFAYDMLMNVMFLIKKGKLESRIDGNRIVFDAGKADQQFLAYNLWRQCYREKKTREDLPIDINPHQASEIFHLNEFTMPDHWDFGDYLLSDYKRVSTSLSLLCMKWLEQASRQETLEQIARNLIIINELSWWIDLLSDVSGVSKSVVESIIEDLTFNNTFHNNDPSYQYFIPLGNKLALSAIFVGSYVRPERNLLLRVSKFDENRFSRISNDCETQQKTYLKQMIKDPNVIVIEPKTKAQKIRSGMDVMFLDQRTLELLVVELKWKIPPSDAKEMEALDNHVKNGLNGMENAKKWVSENLNDLLFQYLGEDWKGIVPADVEFCIALNENIGTGEYCSSLAPVITIDHLGELLSKGIKPSINSLRNAEHRIPNTGIKQEPLHFHLFGYEFEWFSIGLKDEWLYVNI